MGFYNDYKGNELEPRCAERIERLLQCFAPGFRAVT
jgi:hypothetical protein